MKKVCAEIQLQILSTFFEGLHGDWWALQPRSWHDINLDRF